MITLWGRNTSSNVQIVLWCLEVLQLPYERITAGYIHGVVDTDEYAAMNPNRLVPTIQDGDNPPMFESCAIVRYLANQYGNEKFWPSDPVQRAEVDMWAEWSKLHIATLFSQPLFWPIVRLDPAAQEPKRLDASLKLLTRYLDVADKQLGKQAYLVTDELTVADIIFGHILFRYYDIELDRKNHKNIQAYYQRLTEMKTYQDSVMINYDELRFKG